MFRLRYFFLFIIILGGIQSCSKFEDGPLISLRTKKQRISREWKIEYSVNKETGIRHSADYADWLLSFDKSGTFSNVIFYNNIQTTLSGNWILSDNLLKFEIITDSGSQNEFYTITRLTKKELWVQNNLEEIYYYSD